MTEPIHCANEATIPATSATHKSGEVVVHPTYGSCVIKGLRLPTVVGEPIAVSHSKGPTVRIPSASATTFAQNATVNYLAGVGVASGGGGVTAGKAKAAKVSGQLFVDVVVGA